MCVRAHVHERENEREREKERERERERTTRVAEPVAEWLRGDGMTGEKGAGCPEHLPRRGVRQ